MLVANARPIWVKEPTRMRVGSRLLTLVPRTLPSGRAITPRTKNADQKVGMLLLQGAGLAAYAQIAADQMLTLAISAELTG